MNFDYKGKYDYKAYIFDEHPNDAEDLFVESGQKFKRHIKRAIANSKKLGQYLSANVRDYIKKDNRRLTKLYNHIGPGNVYDVHMEDAQPNDLEALTTNELKDRAKHLTPDNKNLMDLLNGKQPLSKPNKLVNYLNHKGAKYTRHLGMYTGGQVIAHMKKEMISMKKAYQRDSTPHTETLYGVTTHVGVNEVDASVDKDGYNFNKSDIHQIDKNRLYSAKIDKSIPVDIKPMSNESVIRALHQNMPKNDTKLKDIADRIVVKHLNNKLNHNSSNMMNSLDKTRKQNINNDKSFNQANQNEMKSQERKRPNIRKQSKKITHNNGISLS